MSSIFLLILYVMLLAAQVVFLVRAIRQPTLRRWGIVFAVEGASLIEALLMMRHYDALPGYGMMPGLTYIGEVLFSLGASWIFGGMLALTAVVCAVVCIKTNKKRR